MIDNQPSDDIKPDDIPPIEPLSTLPRTSHKLTRWLVATIVILGSALLTIGGFWLYGSHGSSKSTTYSTAKTSSVAKINKVSTPSAVQGLELDTSKNYGNKYASGLLPVGDGKYVTSSPEQGYVYACSQYAQSLTSSQGGASSRGPWFTNNNTQYNVNEKLHVEGSVTWQANLTDVVSGSTRTIVTNDLPNHTT